MLITEYYIVKQVTLTELKKIDFLSSPQHLVIVDVYQQKLEIIQSAKIQLRTLYCYNLNILPPILVFVDIDYRHKHKLFQEGALDYISYPIIKRELKYRVQQALFYNEFLQIQEKNTLEQVGGQPYFQQNHPITADYLIAKKAVEYLSSRLDQNIKLSDLTREMGANKNKLYQVFKTYFGKTVLSWLREQRMQHAADLLRNTS